jgi:hypothetical protein
METPYSGTPSEYNVLVNETADYLAMIGRVKCHTIRSTNYFETKTIIIAKQLVKRKLHPLHNNITC